MPPESLQQESTGRVGRRDRGLFTQRERERERERETYESCWIEGTECFIMLVNKGTDRRADREAKTETQTVLTGRGVLTQITHSESALLTLKRHGGEIERAGDRDSPAFYSVQREK